MRLKNSVAHFRWNTVEKNHNVSSTLDVRGVLNIAIAFCHSGGIARSCGYVAGWLHDFTILPTTESVWHDKYAHITKKNIFITLANLSFAILPQKYVVTAAMKWVYDKTQCFLKRFSYNFNTLFMLSVSHVQIVCKIYYYIFR